MLVVLGPEPQASLAQATGVKFEAADHSISTWVALQSNLSLEIPGFLLPLDMIPVTLIPSMPGVSARR